MVFYERLRETHLLGSYLILIDTLDRFGGDLRILLDNITVSCDEFIVFCKKGLDHVMSGRRFQ